MSIIETGGEFLKQAVKFLDKFSFIGTSTVFVKLDYLDGLMSPIASQLGMELTIIKYTVAMFLVFPFSILLRLLPHKNLKNFVSMLGGIILMQWIFGADWIHSFVSSFVTYLICLIGPRKYCHYLVFFWAMTYMTGSHLYRMYVEYLTGAFDFTGTQMVVTMKITSFAYNLYDGTADHANVFKTHDNKAKAKIYAERKKFSITKLPSLLEYFGYVYCFTCLLAGPAFEYQDYIRAIDGSAFEHHGHDKKDDDDKKMIISKGYEPSPLIPGLKKFLYGTCFLIGHILLNAKFPLTNLYNPEFIASNSFLYRCFYLYAALIGARFKFYFAWIIAEGSSNLAGFGFQGYAADGSPIGWDGVSNVDILGFEFASCLSQLSRAWNKRTQGWLERYTYQRTNRSLAITYFVSALWHGLYPGFFIFFMSMPLVSNVERLFRAKITPLLAPGYDGYNVSTYPKTFLANAYWFACFVTFMSLMNYLAQVFHFGSLERSIVGLGSYYYLGHFGSLLAYMILSLNWTITGAPQNLTPAASVKQTIDKKKV